MNDLEDQRALIFKSIDPQSAKICLLHIYRACVSCGCSGRSGRISRMHSRVVKLYKKTSLFMNLIRCEGTSLEGTYPWRGQRNRKLPACSLMKGKEGAQQILFLDFICHRRCGEIDLRIQYFLKICSQMSRCVLYGGRVWFGAFSYDMRGVSPNVD